MKYIKLYKTLEEYYADKANLTPPYIVSIPDHITSDGVSIPGSIFYLNTDDTDNTGEEDIENNPEESVETITKYEFNGTVYNTKEEAVSAMFTLMDSTSDFTDLIFESGKTLKYHFDGDTPSIDNINSTVWYDEQTDGWQFHSDANIYTTDIQEFIEDLKSDRTIYKSDYDCVINNNLYLKDNILCDIQQDISIIPHTKDWSDFVEEIQESITVPAGELPTGYVIATEYEYLYGYKSINEIIEDGSYFPEDHEYHYTYEQILDFDIVKVNGDDYGRIYEFEYICKVSDWNWDEENTITKYQYHVTINGSEIGVYNKLGEDFVGDNYFTDNSYADYNSEWYYNNENTAYRAIYDYLNDNWSSMPLEEKIEWLPYVDYSVYYPTINDSYTNTDLTEYIIAEEIDSITAFNEETLIEYTEDKIKEFINNLPDFEVWNIDGSDYTIGYPDYSPNYDTIEAAIENISFCTGYKTTTAEYEVYPVNGNYYTLQMLYDSNLVVEDINNYKSGSETILDFNSLIKEVKE